MLAGWSRVPGIPPDLLRNTGVAFATSLVLDMEAVLGHSLHTAVKSSAIFSNTSNQRYWKFSGGGPMS